MKENPSERGRRSKLISPKEMGIILDAVTERRDDWDECELQEAIAQAIKWVEMTRINFTLLRMVLERKLGMLPEPDGVMQFCGIADDTTPPRLTLVPPRR